MKKRAISSLLVVLFAMSIVLPALATGAAENEMMPAAVVVELRMIPEDEPNEAPEDGDAGPELTSFILLDGIPQFLEYEVLNGTTYATVASFVSMADPLAAVEEKNGVVTAYSARVEQVEDGKGNTEAVVRETLSMTVSTSVPYIVVNGRYLYAKDSIVMLNGQVAAPVRILAQVFNLEVGYDAGARKAKLAHAEGCGAYIEPGDSFYDEDALYWLSHIINAESGTQSLEGKIAVGNVVMNRVASPEFPNSIYSVLYQKNQFSPAASGSIKKTPNAQSVVAAKLVLEGVQIVPTALFFNMKGISSYASRNRSYVTTIGSHAFYA